MQTNEQEWPTLDESKLRPHKDGEVERERRKVKLQFPDSSVASEADFQKANNFSTMMSFRKRVAFVRRPFRNRQVKQDSRSSQQPTTRSSSRQSQGKAVIEPLTPEELEEAEVWILRREQKKDFGKELKILEKGQHYGKESMTTKTSI